jgi:hypothetical protein
LLSIYDNARDLVPDAQDPAWTDNVKQYIEDAVKIAKYAAVAGGMGALAGQLVGRKDLSSKIAVGVAVPAVLCALWQAHNEEQARNRARKFLALVEDIKDDRKKIEKRMEDIARSLAYRFEYAVQKLPASEDGVEELASFFSTAIARDILAESKRILESKMSPNEIVQLATQVAVPQNSDDPIYSNWFQNKPLKNVDKNYWTVPGLLLRSPIYVVPLDKYYVRDSKLTVDNRADKYPSQKVYQQLARYVEADGESLAAIKAMNNLPVEEKLRMLRDEYAAMVERENINDQQSQVSEDGLSEEAVELELEQEDNQSSAVILQMAAQAQRLKLENDYNEELHDEYQRNKNNSWGFGFRFY